MKIKLLAVLFAFPAFVNAQQNLIINGSFDSPDGPLTGWTTDYAWTHNKHYVGNASRVIPVASFQGQRNTVKILPHGEVGSKMESMLIPYEQGDKFRATLKIQGGRFRIYFSGYQWKPGIRPHNNPTLQEMRQSYRSKAIDSSASGWETLTLELPGVDVSDLGLKHLQRVRFITLYIFFLKEGHVDDVKVVKLN